MTSEQAPTAGIEAVLDRSLARWRGLSPEDVVDGSYAQTLFCIRDAQHDILTLAAQLAALEDQVRSARADALEEVSEAARDLVTLLDDYMVVTSLTANDRYKTALSRLRAALNPPESSNAAS